MPPLLSSFPSSFLLNTEHSIQRQPSIRRTIRTTKPIGPKDQKDNKSIGPKDQKDDKSIGPKDQKDDN